MAARRRQAKVDDGYARETFTQPREQARQTARAFLVRWPAARPSIAPCIKEFLIDAAEIQTERGAADALFFGLTDQNWRDDGAGDYYVGLDTAVQSLQTNDPRTYDLYRKYVFKAAITAFLQWPDTAKAIAQLSMRLADEKEPEASRDLVMMRRRSGSHSHLVPA